jgi:tetratricopeptide (TPR) repeat protein
VLGAGERARAAPEARQRFKHDLAPFSRTLGTWANAQTALYDELYAHLAGDALPVTAGRFTACKQPRVPEKAYRERRTRYLGQGPATSALEAAARLEHLEASSLAERYFPEVALAWRAVERLREPARVDAALLEFDCIAVDECQDLTPIEACLIVQLAARINAQRPMPIPLLLSGDEAQTVRPTDFEWGWLNDLLHTQLGKPAEYKLSANLRSPHGIAELVNRVWDLYSYVHKQERPSGTGYAEIEADAADQILYCSASAGPELDELLTALSTREGLALVTFDDTPPAYVPAAARAAVLTVAEAKGLDFHSVCVLDGGRHVERIVRDDSRFRLNGDIEGLRRRLAIDQLRVALSRPTERLFWLDINPTDQIVRHSIDFLNGGNVEGGVAACVPAALLKTLDEDELDPEERVQRCQTDARQFLEVKPEIAWSRAQQAVTLLGRPGTLAAIADEAARKAAYLTLAEVCFVLGLRNARLAPELGRPDLFQEATRAATNAGRFGLATMLDAVGRLHRATVDNRLNALLDVAHMLPARKGEIEPWLMVELNSRASGWIEQLETALFNAHNAALLIEILPPFYELLEIPDRQTRTQRLEQRAIQFLIKDKQFAPALAALRKLAERQPKLEAVCYEGLGDFRNAAECHASEGNLKEALACYRAAPDLDAALRLVGEIDDHPAAASLVWISKLRQLVNERPEKFTKLVTAAEKKLLEDLLEQALGVTRRKPAPRKAATKKAAPRKKAAAKKTSGSYF